MKPIVGGGAKKILYTLNTVKRIGLNHSAKALTANNTCKACALGMGGQQGGMTNELGEFPSVCNKSVQAQSTDIQSPIPLEIFEHSLDDFKALSAYEIEHLGRLNTPVIKRKGQNYFSPVSWAEALSRAAQKLNDTPAQQSFFYSSGRSSNEAGFILQLLARCLGSNNINNCSYYCHQATGVGLNETVGTGTATIELADLKRCDTVFLIGANPSSNHPRLIHQLKGVRERGGQVVVINPAKEPGLVKFAVPKSVKSLIAGGTEIASHYVQPKIGSDWFLMMGMAKVILAKGAQDSDFIQASTEGFECFKQNVESLSFETICQETDLSQAEIEDLANLYIQAEHAVFAWGMGVTHHQHGVENIELIASLALLRGMVGKAGAGLLPLRGHSNVQGIGSVGVKPNIASSVREALSDLVKQPLPEQEGLDTLACLQAADAGNMHLALLMGGNLLEASPHLSWSMQAMDKIDCKIALTSTLNKGHIFGHDNSELIILPVAVRDEERQATTQESMFNYLRLSDGGIERLDNVRSEGDILNDLAQRVLESEQASVFERLNHYQNTRQSIAKAYPQLEILSQIDQSKREASITGRVLHQPQFSRASGKAQFTDKQLCAQSYKQSNAVHPFLLATIRSEGQFNSIIYEELDSYRYNAPRDALLMNPVDAERLGFQEHDRVEVSSTSGTMQAQVRFFDIPEGNLMAYYPEANILTGLDIDPRSKTPNFKSMAVDVRAV